MSTDDIINRTRLMENEIKVRVRGGVASTGITTSTTDNEDRDFEDQS